jgi:hypothetical protein
MNLSYTLNSHTGDHKRIFGNVIINSKAKIADGGLSFSIISFQMYCEGIPLCGCGKNANKIIFPAGPPASGDVATGLAIWSMGEWNNGGTGVWFQHADSTRYEGDGSFGKLDLYKYLGPRIELGADLVEQGPFQPVGYVHLTWNPQFYLRDK